MKKLLALTLLTALCGTAIAAGPAYHIRIPAPGIKASPPPNGGTGTPTPPVVAPEPEPEAGPSMLVANYAVLEFPDAQVGSYSSEDFRVLLTNAGDKALILTDVPQINGDFEGYGMTCATEVELEPGGSCAYLVMFTPVQVGLRTGSVTFKSDAGSVSVSMRGIGLSLE